MKHMFYLFQITLFACFLLGIPMHLAAQNLEFPKLEPLPEALDSIPEYEAKSIARRLANQAQDIQRIFEQQTGRASMEREVYENQLAASEADTLATKEERREIAKALKTAKSAEKDAQRSLKKAEKAMELAFEVVELDSAELRKNLPKAYKRIAALIPEPEEVEDAPIADMLGAVAVSDPEGVDELPVLTDSTQVEIPDENSDKKDRKKQKKEAPSRPPLKTYDPAADVMLNPPPRPCALTVDTRDAFSGERRREVAQEELFRFTNPSLKSYFTDREHIICRAALSTNSGNQILQLHFIINDVNAQRSFGNLPRNGVAILKLLDGETFTLYNVRADEGKPSEDKQSFTFVGQYVVDSGMFKKLKKSLLDKIRIAWSTGYEDYDVQNVDFFVRQLECLLKD